MFMKVSMRKAELRSNVIHNPSAQALSEKLPQAIYSMVCGSPMEITYETLLEGLDNSFRFFLSYQHEISHDNRTKYYAVQAKSLKIISLNKAHKETDRDDRYHKGYRHTGK